MEGELAEKDVLLKRLRFWLIEVETPAKPYINKLEALYKKDMLIQIHPDTEIETLNNGAYMIIGKAIYKTETIPIKGIEAYWLKKDSKETRFLKDGETYTDLNYFTSMRTRKNLARWEWKKINFFPDLLYSKPVSHPKNFIKTKRVYSKYNTYDITFTEEEKIVSTFKAALKEWNIIKPPLDSQFNADWVKRIFLFPKNANQKKWVERIAEFYPEVHEEKYLPFIMKHLLLRGAI